MDGQCGSLRQVLHAAGRRVTGPRALLLDIIQAQSGHLDADELYRLARQRQPRISLSTVYRTLNVLADLGLVAQVSLGQDHNHYEAGAAAEHHHLVCSQCGRVVEFNSTLVRGLRAALAAEYDFVVAEMRIDASGLCPGCQAAGSLASRG